MLENKPEQIHNIVPVLSIWWGMAVHSTATNKLIHISGNMLLKGLRSLLVCLKKVSSLISKSSLCPIWKGHTVKFHQDVHSVSLKNVQQNLSELLPKDSSMQIHALALKFTIFTYPQKKTIYLSSILPESPQWNLSCITQIHLFLSKEQREAMCLQKGNKHTNFVIQGSLTTLCFSFSGQLPPPTSYTNKLHTHSTAKGTCKLLCCWTAFCKEAHPRALWFLSSSGCHSAAHLICHRSCREESGRHCRRSSSLCTKDSMHVQPYLCHFRGICSLFLRFPVLEVLRPF